MPSLLKHSHSNEIGIILVLVASMSYGVGIVYTRKFLGKLPSLIGPCWQTLMAFLVLIPFSLYFDHPFSLPMPSQTAWFGVIALAVLGTAVAFIIYFEIVKLAGATFLSLVTLIFPLVGILLGVTLLHEKLSWNAYAGCGLILIGLAIANPEVKLKLFSKKNAPHK